MPELASVKSKLTREVPFLKQLGIERTGIFGSVAREEDGPDSDVDILLELRPDHAVTLLTLADLEISLSEKLHRKVDLVILRSLKPRIRDQVLREVVYVDP